MRIAIAHWQGRISPVLDVSEELVLLEADGRQEIDRRHVPLVGRNPFVRAREVANLQADVLLCGALSSAMETALLNNGVQVVGFLCGDLEAVISAYLQGQLQERRFLMPGCCRRRNAHRFRGGRGGPGRMQTWERS